MRCIVVNFGDVLTWVTGVGTLAAAAAAFTAVWVALKTHRESQASLRQSTRPILEFTTHFHAKSYKVVLHNAGQRTAIIKSMQVVFSGTSRKIASPRDIDETMSKLGEFLKTGVLTTDRFVMVADTALQFGRALLLVQTGFVREISRAELETIPTVLYFTARYQSLFGESWDAYSQQYPAVSNDRERTQGSQ
jgi:hypothetical protein